MFFASLSTPSNSFNTSHITANEFHSLGWPKIHPEGDKMRGLKGYYESRS